eukprot:CAMPEP_0196601228 /NCGR_PEP_ID=MMETSP1081-20130531/95798_1 /TAXON_ID=36882 /ORGANISM="Pyramimonas amylifera, Strain CCMP720" /LENGTH=66 /DNA_ID=CAMNT_0041927097 /DNA_START=834 /DNA_END=1034 /DNA_ORIENTATION=+
MHLLHTLQWWASGGLGPEQGTQNLYLEYAPLKMCGLEEGPSMSPLSNLLGLGIGVGCPGEEKMAAE